MLRDCLVFWVLVNTDEYGYIVFGMTSGHRGVVEFLESSCLGILSGLESMTVSEQNLICSSPLCFVQCLVLVR